MNTLNIDILRSLSTFMDLRSKTNFVLVDKTTYLLNDKDQQKSLHLKRMIRSKSIEYIFDCMVDTNQARILTNIIPYHAYKDVIHMIKWSKPLSKFFSRLLVKKSLLHRQQLSNLIRRKREENDCFDSIRTNQTLRCVRRRTCMIY